MSAQVTEAHRELVRKITGRTYSVEYFAQLIAVSEAKAVADLQCSFATVAVERTELSKERDQLRAERDAFRNTLNVAGPNMRSLYAENNRLVAELAKERARLDYLSTRGFDHRHHETGDHLAFEWTISSTNELKDVSLREVIDAAMQEETK